MCALASIGKYFPLSISVGNASTYLHQILTVGPWTKNFVVLPEAVGAMTDHESWRYLGIDGIVQIVDGLRDIPALVLSALN
jgi:hypothetical protein